MSLLADPSVVVVVVLPTTTLLQVIVIDVDKMCAINTTDINSAREEERRERGKRIRQSIN